MPARLQRCPHCDEAIDIRTLPHPSIVKNYRLCPVCGGAFTVDSDTKRRQAIFILTALVSLVLTCLLYFAGPAWLPMAIVSYVALAVAIYWGNKKVYFVPYEDKNDSIGDG